jgi:riboflavin-specific deaminase-like protein
MKRKAVPPKTKLPFVFSNFAMSADGKIAFAKNNFAAFGSDRDRRHMMELRATADAVMCGARTVELTGTILGNGGERFRKQRLKQGLAEYPLRVITTRSGSIDLNANIFKKRFSPIIVLTTERIPKSTLKSLQAVAEVGIFGRQELDFRAAFSWLSHKWKVRRLLCEGGGELHGALVRAGMVNELHLTVCPQIFGGKQASTIADAEGVSRLADAAQFKWVSTKAIGGELFAIFTIKKPSYSQG